MAPKFITAKCDTRKHMLWKEPIRETNKSVKPQRTFVSFVV